MNQVQLCVANVEENIDVVFYFNPTRLSVAISMIHDSLRISTGKFVFHI